MSDETNKICEMWIKWLLNRLKYPDQSDMLWFFKQEKKTGATRDMSDFYPQGLRINGATYMGAGHSNCTFDQEGGPSEAVRVLVRLLFT